MHAGDFVPETIDQFTAGQERTVLADYPAQESVNRMIPGPGREDVVTDRFHEQHCD